MDQIPDIGDEENNSKNIEEIFQDGQNTESEVSVEEPKIGMEFNSVDELYEYYKRYGKQLGFGISKRTSSKKGAEEARYITIVCNKAGSPRQTNKNMLRPRPTSVTNCRARINASVGRDGGWKITSVELAHNHVLSPSKARFHACHRVVNTHAKRRLELNDAAGIRLNKSFSSFVIGAGGYENISFLEKDARNHIQKMRKLMLQEGDAEAMHKYFVKMQATNQNFFYTMDLDKDGRLRNVFWADARSRVAYEEFGDVVTFDTTYLVDKYDMPFAPFVGVNHHGHSILFGCGLISAENTETFIWLFESWLTCMNGHAPQGIITDQDMAMRKAIEHVFPHTQHRRCLWHIMKKIPEKLSGYKEYKTIKFTLKAAVYNSLTPQEFEERWGTMIGKFNLHENEWLDSLFAIRHDWVPSYVKDRFWAGMSTTQRSESINAFFDGVC